MEGGKIAKKRILCLHGFRTSGSFLNKQISKWDPSILLILTCWNICLNKKMFKTLQDFPDGIYPAEGKSEIEGIFPPPYFEWFQFNKDFTAYTNLEACIDRRKRSILWLVRLLSALLLGYQAQGKILKEHPPMSLFVSISGSKFREPSIAEVAYKDPINVRSVHFVGEKDWLKLPSEELAAAFEAPLIIRHPQGHTVPRLDEEAVEKLGSWIKYEEEEPMQIKGEESVAVAVAVEKREAEAVEAVPA